MISQHAIDVVKSTVPVLQEHGEALTEHFYKRMFAHNPEVGPYFNPANQAEGTQQRALAGAICAYAANIDMLDVLGGAVEQIAHKHASLMIKAEHYPIVGEHLLASIRELLGEAATDEVIDAWSEAYGLLAGILIGREQQIYQHNADKPGGWEGFRQFKVSSKEIESRVITSFYLQPVDGGPVADYLPGQYITVRAETPDGSSTMRNYSLSEMPGQDCYRISVKKESDPEGNAPEGYVSGLFHEHIEVGDVIEVGPPCGEFFLDVNDHHERPLVLMAAGVGITPIFPILRAALDAPWRRDVVLIHACLNEEVQAFGKAIDALSEQHDNLTVHYRYSDPEPEGVRRKGPCSTGFVDAALIESFIPDRDADYYFCGPKAFMANIYQDLLAWGIPGTQVHFEFFGPKQELGQPA